ncbi:isopentenyl pyrophosphate isomerase [Syncephalis fuscata]|nr:isopentenyl pyrophosphate isomerase [Syncephalis fuscata]
MSPSSSIQLSQEVNLSEYDAEQARLMEECCIVIDEQDQRIGAESKKTCHLMTNIDQGLLHRAFSVFLFDDQGRLLLQQRADEKITFPGFWTNTCCSHPLNKEDELTEENQLGVKRAARRKLEHELGIPESQISLDEFKYLTRIHYKAPSNGIWGEHEIDYILFLQTNIELNLNPNEVKDTRYVTSDELRAMFKQADEGEIKLTPWFKLIADNMLFNWWKNLDQLDAVTDINTIHRY